MGARLTIERHGGPTVVYDLATDQPVTLGRHRSNTIVLHDEHASRWHAQIMHEDGQWVLREVEQPRNGTRVNGQRIRQQAALQDGHEIGIGDTRLHFCLTGADCDEGVPPVASRTAGFKDTLPLAPEPCGEALPADVLNALFAFIAQAAEATEPQPLIRQALLLLAAQTGADVTGFLSLDPDDPLPRLVVPERASVDAQLSRQLTQQVQRDGRAVWLGAATWETDPGGSLGSFADALCVPLRAGAAPVGALHVYKTADRFTERDLRFCEVLASYLAHSLHILRARRTLEAENSRLRTHLAAGDDLIGDSPPLQQLRQLIARVAPRSCTVLIAGESGVGKELVALALHRHSPRREGPLVVVNCAAIAASLPEAELFGHRRGAFTGADHDRAGLFQQADEGTLFLDEVGELSLDCQAKLLRVIEGKGFRPVGADGEVCVDVRIIAATNRDLQGEIRAGRFREDLFFRLQGITLPVPPLRAHAADIPALARFFLGKLALECRREVHLTEAALVRLQAYSWPGNVRQLLSVLENAVIMSDRTSIDVDDLRLPESTCAPPPVLNLEQLEIGAIRQALRETRGNLTQAAKLLGVARETMGNKMKKYGITRDPP